MDRREFLATGALAIGGLMAGIEDLIIGPKPLEPILYAGPAGEPEGWESEPELAVHPPDSTIVGFDDSGFWMAPQNLGTTFRVKFQSDAYPLVHIYGTRSVANPTLDALFIDVRKHTDNTLMSELQMTSTNTFLKALTGIATEEASLYLLSGSEFRAMIPGSGYFNVVNTSQVSQGRIDNNGRFYPGNQLTRSLYDDGTRTAVSGGLSVVGGQIAFPATQVPSAGANVLDDYEEQSWTPTLGGTATYMIQVGRYIKIGKLVTAWCDLNVNVIGTGSTTTISGLPFTSANVAINHSGSVSYFNTLAVNTITLLPRNLPNTSTIQFAGMAASGASVTDGLAIFGNSTRVILKVTYEAAN